MISILMATYNGEIFLSEQLESIISQTYKDFELIICDDHSTDNTISILQEYQIKDSRIKLFFNDTNLGFKKTFEKAIKICNGEYIAFCDQDDIWEPFKLMKSIAMIGKNDVYCSNALLIDENNKSDNKTMMDYLYLKYIPSNNMKKAKHFIHHNICQGTTMLCNANFIKNNLPIPNEVPYHDWYFALLAASHNGLIYDKQCTLRYRQHSNTVTGKKNANTFLNQLLKIHNSNNTDIYNNNIILCNLIIQSDKFSSSLKQYAKECLDYFTKMSMKKDFSTFVFFTKNYSDIIWDKNIVHKLLFICKRFFGVFLS